MEDAKRNAIERKEQIRKLKQEKAELWERKQKLDLQVRKVIVYLGFMEELAQMTEVGLKKTGWTGIIYSKMSHCKVGTYF